MSEGLRMWSALIAMCFAIGFGITLGIRLALWATSAKWPMIQVNVQNVELRRAPSGDGGGET